MPEDFSGCAVCFLSGDIGSQPHSQWHELDGGMRWGQAERLLLYNSDPGTLAIGWLSVISPVSSTTSPAAQGRVPPTLPPRRSHWGFSLLASHVAQAGDPFGSCNSRWDSTPRLVWLGLYSPGPCESGRVTVGRAPAPVMSHPALPCLASRCPQRRWGARLLTTVPWAGAPTSWWSLTPTCTSMKSAAPWATPALEVRGQGWAGWG